MKLSDYFPDQFEGWETAGEPNKNTMQPMVPNDQTANTPYLRAAIPLTFQYQMDTVKQWNTMGLSNFRVAPIGPNGIAAQNAAAQSAVTNIINQSSSSTVVPSTFVPSIPVNVQTVETYVVKLADLSTLDTFTNSAGGTIVLPGASLPPGSFSGGNSTSGFGATAAPTGPALYAGAVISVINTETDLGTPNCTPNGSGWVAIDSAQNGSYASVYSKLVPAGTFAASYSLGTSVAWIDSLVFFGNCNTAPVAVQLLNIFSGGTSGTQSHSATFSSSVTAGNAILVVVTIGAVPWDAIHNRYNFTALSVSDGVNTYGEVAQGTGGVPTGDGCQQVVFLAQKVAAGSTTITVNLVTPVGFANGGISATAYEINLGTATPIPSGFPAGWFCYLENSAQTTPSASAPVFTVTSPAEIDGIFQTIPLGQNEGVIVAFDGTNWWTERGVGGGGAPIVFPISIADGGTGTSTPGLLAGSGISISGPWPDQTISASGIAPPSQNQSLWTWPIAAVTPTSYGSVNPISSHSMNFTANQINLFYLNIDKPIQVGNFTFQVIGSDTHHYDWGMYNTSGTLVWNLGPQIFNSTGQITTALAQGTVTIQPGNYWLAFTGDGTGITFTGLTSTQLGNLMFFADSKTGDPAWWTSVTTSTGGSLTGLTVTMPSAPTTATNLTSGLTNSFGNQPVLPFVCLST
jgi:hypothetical protein